MLPDFEEVSYTLTGAIYLPSKKGIRISVEIQENAKKHFSFCEECSSHLFDEINVPAFAIIPGNHSFLIVKNPRLADFHFQKTINSFDAFYKTAAFLEKNRESRIEKNKPNQSNLWTFNPFFSAFLSATK